ALSPRPRATLFPYTTLFRSGLREAGIQKVFTSGSSTQSLANYIQELINTHEKLEPPKKISHIGIAVHRLDDALPFYTDMQYFFGDRKSTRLNSSHVSTSYAV